MNTTPPNADARFRPRLCQRLRLQWEPIQEAYVLLYPEGTVRLNASAGEILSRCDGTHDLDEIIGELEKLFGTSGLATEVYRFIDHGRQRGWLD
ncbi:pyrroloquinoline quinone biosynthesis peptide chaperone PqqD [Paraburkholderia sp. LEh10]|uniref:pyrroloquinoline quinone biosynthesis peptide chaperone PqqD n=1 Tax=Paraburkholderia sp. LEh10 TaxID=2821353 RepID=UPI001AE511E7|nr:pyrroloquinoline quinone biosynthesis peptide chaperone PqqD [Paraburkholderia sp. LEh10]MBP0590327.1 pyrroloquinoline quinone biosynthesis peptide chaperone PqqD [Paraburkholderia sp. LEh10]